VNEIICLLGCPPARGEGGGRERWVLVTMCLPASGSCRDEALGVVGGKAEVTAEYETSATMVGVPRAVKLELHVSSLREARAACIIITRAAGTVMSSYVRLWLAPRAPYILRVSRAPLCEWRIIASNKTVCFPARPPTERQLVQHGAQYTSLTRKRKILMCKGYYIESSALC